MGSGLLCTLGGKLDKKENFNNGNSNSSSSFSGIAEVYLVRSTIRRSQTVHIISSF